MYVLPLQATTLTKIHNLYEEEKAKWGEALKPNKLSVIS